MKKINQNIKVVFIALMTITIGFSACTSDLNVSPQDDDNLLSEDLFANEDSYKQVLAGGSMPIYL